MSHPSLESSPQQPPQPPEDTRSFILTPDQLSAKQADWQAKGFSPSAIQELTALFTESHTILDRLRAFQAKGDQHYTDNPKAKQELDDYTAFATLAKARIATRRQELYDQLAEEKRLAGGEPNLPPPSTPDTTPLSHATPEQLRMAKEVMGTDYLGPEAITTTWDVTLTPEQIPPIPFSKADLERAKQLGQFLILRIDKTADGKPLTMQTMEEVIQPKMDAVGTGEVVRNTDWCATDPFFTTDTPQPHWALVSKDTIPNSTNQTYLQQTETIITYLTTHVFENQPIPSPYKEAIEEFEREKTGIKAIPKEDWKLIAERLAQLQITQLIRVLPVEVLYDLLTVFQTTGVRLIPSKWTYTSRLSSTGRLVNVGHFDETGVNVRSGHPVIADARMGVSSSRSL